MFESTAAAATAIGWSLLSACKMVHACWPDVHFLQSLCTGLHTDATAAIDVRRLSGLIGRGNMPE